MLLITNDPNCFARMPRINFKGLGLFVLFGSFDLFVIRLTLIFPTKFDEPAT